MPPTPKTEIQRQALRTLIIDAARELFVARGVEAVTMREIAKRIDYSATSIYSHFEDKDALIRAICDTDFLALADQLKCLMQISHPLERLSAFGRGYAQFALTHPNHYRLMFMDVHHPCDPEKSSVQQNNAEQDAYYQLKMIVQAVFDAGYFRPELQNVELIVQTLFAGMHGVCALHISMAEGKWVPWASIEDRLNLMHAMALRGLLKAEYV